MARKTTTADEKEKILLSLFTPFEFYHVKELESLAPKKGLRAGALLDTLKTILDDSKIQAEKCGVSNIYFKIYNNFQILAKIAEIRNSKKSNENKRLENKIKIYEENEILKQKKKEIEKLKAKTKKLEKECKYVLEEDYLKLKDENDEIKSEIQKNINEIVTVIEYLKAKGFVGSLSEGLKMLSIKEDDVMDFL